MDSGIHIISDSLEDLTTLALALAEEYYKKGLEVKFERKSSKDASV
jgi:hypothetical protein